MGMYLLGPSIENFSTYPMAVYSSFDMMNANYPFEDLQVASLHTPTHISAHLRTSPPASISPRLTLLAQGAVGSGGLKMASVIFYYYSFIGFHYFMLLNLIIAMVVEAYIDVVSKRKEVVTRTLRNNIGPLFNDLGNMFRELSWWYAPRPPHVPWWHARHALPTTHPMAARGMPPPPHAIALCATRQVLRLQPVAVTDAAQ